MTIDTVDLTVDGIAVGGAGIGRTETGRVVFVPGTAPGDRVKAVLTEQRKRWARGRVVEVYERGPDRVDPACPHFGTCGGCRLMHLNDVAQGEALRQGVADTLARIGGVTLPVPPIVAGTHRLGYRNRVSFTVRRRGGRVFAGYHAERGRRLVEIEACPLAEPGIARAWRDLRSAWGTGARHLPPGGELRLTLRTNREGDVALLVTGGRDTTGASPAAAARSREGAKIIADETGGLTSYWWAPADGPRRHLFGRETLPDVWNAIELDLLPQAFLQVNREIAGAIEDHLDEGLEPIAGRRVLDLYAGVGLRAIRWARAGARVVAVEANPDAVATGRKAARSGEGRQNVGEPEYVESTVEAALPGLDAEIVIVNPPRAGLSEAVIECLCASKAERLVYVSCDPGTLARDVARLAVAWAPTRAQPFDAFPHTGHVETVVWFERRSGTST
ncbi:MAG: class I SAM-dependent RNA methyltransferase [Gemmatimonadota bacterium]